LACQVTRIRAIVRFVTTTPIAAVLGANCRRIRTDAGVTQDELARAARQVGLKWTASKVRDFEVGRSAPTFATVLALTAALNSVITRTRVTARTTQRGHEIAIQLDPVRMADLVSFGGEVSVTEDFELAGERLVDYCSGGTWSTEDGVQSLSSNSSVLGLTEERVAAGLGISTDQLCDVSLRLWNTTLATQRDRLAGPNASAQRKGQITRQLKAELEKAITDGND
jgi:transcriptional regulator with XRE-family HTH domain